MIHRAWIPDDTLEPVHIILPTQKHLITACLFEGWLPEGQEGFVSQPMPGQPENRCKKCMEALNGNND